MDLVLDRVCVRYGRRTVLDSLSLTVPAGAFVALVGPNGSGKSTLVRAVTGAVPLAGGSIRLGGRDLRQLSAAARARQLAVLGQETKVDFAFSVQEVVGMGRMPHLRRFARESERDFQVIRQAMAATGTLDLADRSITTLSGGERQRVLFARALAQEPRLLILDEPTAHLDMAHSVELLGLVRRRNREEGLTVIAVLHDLNLAAQYADRILVLAEGRLVADGTPAAVVTPELIGRVWATAVQVVPHPVSGAPQVILLGGTVPGSSGRGRGAHG
jgi:iron complex transport system ATP-binding protein